jgi:hypothetical protein
VCEADIIDSRTVAVFHVAVEVDDFQKTKRSKDFDIKVGGCIFEPIRLDIDLWDFFAFVERPS